jgi:hypothetical protein
VTLRNRAIVGTIRNWSYREYSGALFQYSQYLRPVFEDMRKTWIHVITHTHNHVKMKSKHQGDAAEVKEHQR